MEIFLYYNKDFISEDQIGLVEQIQHIFDILGSDILKTFKDTQYQINLLKVLSLIQSDMDHYISLRNVINSIPVERQKCCAKGFIWAYINDTDIRNQLLSMYDTPNSELSSIQYSPLATDNKNFGQVYSFLHWCSFDLNSELSLYLNKLLENERSVAVLKARSQRKTLQEIGENLGITRERVRQIEAKARWFFIIGNYSIYHCKSNS